MRRNFKRDVLALSAVAASTALLALGVKADAPIFSRIAVVLASVALVMKFILSKDRRKQNLPNSPRRRATDSNQDTVSVAR